MNISTLKKMAAVITLGTLSVTAMAGDNSRADRMGERPIAEFSQGRALMIGQLSELEQGEAFDTLAASPASGSLDNLADLKVQRDIGEYSKRLQQQSDLAALTSPAAGSEAAISKSMANALVIGLSYESVDYGDLTASQKRQRFFGQDG